MSSIGDLYEIKDKLGGQLNRKFGAVYLVENRETKQTGILKCIEKLPENRHLQERLIQEATFDFDFQGLPSTLYFSEDDKEIILIRKFIPGKPLDEYWKTISSGKKQKILTEILIQLSPVLNYLKDQRIVHCDIKPSNILVDDKNGQLTVSLIDFGMALKIDAVDQRKILFPLGYAAPELILNRLDLIDHRTDLFSLGIVIWKQFSGRLPLTHPNPSIFTNLQLTHPLPESSDNPKGLDTLLKKLCAKHQFRTAPNLLEADEVANSLMKAIDQRYNSIDEFIKDYQNLPERKKWIFF